ncbi:hypothetical protein [Halalkalicoccus salilacus]|uniref:hypothetical protein n=1 Tax=Halalkalicoccus sp. GCM10025704 TaxID=3252662 RepID=UPI003617EEC9
MAPSRPSPSPTSTDALHRSASTGEAGSVLTHTPGLSDAWRREAWAFANIMLATEFETSSRPVQI